MAFQERPPRPSYPSDLSDDEWSIVADMIPPPVWIANLQEPQHHPREFMNAIRYRTRTGTAWRLLPHDFPPWSTVFKCYQRWIRHGVLEAIHNELRRQVRIAAGRQPEPTAAIIDSQSVKCTDVGGPKGFDAGKKGERAKATPSRRRDGSHSRGSHYTSINTRP